MKRDLLLGRAGRADRPRGDKLGTLMHNRLHKVQARLRELEVDPDSYAPTSPLEGV